MEQATYTLAKEIMVSIRDKIERKLEVFGGNVIFLYDEIRLFCKDHPQILPVVLGLLSIILFCLLIAVGD
jgi:CHASE1-domain containing sensor protein